ncbi:MAG: hypothetical protein GF350_12360 [Chitinivibrionales bacterium]|nr:hypothetical protein [Chitinivibrionales bacterium]
MKQPDLLIAINPLIDAFNQHGIEYYISGSVAGSAYGIARATLDVDIVATIEKRHVPLLLSELSSQYYITAESINEAITRQSSFNMIHLETMIKIDIFILKESEFAISAFQRKVTDELDEDFPRKYFLSSPEDIIINKLIWYNKGRRISDQQWKDIVGILKVQAAQLDYPYIESWTQKLGLYPLYKKALDDAGIELCNPE